MTTRYCGTCRWSINHDFEEQRANCSEPHTPRNARGEVVETVRLWQKACEYYDERIPAPQKRSRKRTAAD